MSKPLLQFQRCKNEYMKLQGGRFELPIFHVLKDFGQVKNIMLWSYVLITYKLVSPLFGIWPYIFIVVEEAATLTNGQS